MGLALGIDYSLFIVSRLREERHQRRVDARGDPASSPAPPPARSSSAACAFALAMLGMFLMPDAMLRSLARGRDRRRLVSIVVALTLPSRAADGPRRPRRAPARPVDREARRRAPPARRAASGAAPSARSSAARASALIARRARCCSPLASPVLGLKLGASGPQSLPDSTVGKQGLIALERDFPTGATTPVDIVVDGRPPTPASSAGVAAPARASWRGDRDFAARAHDHPARPGDHRLSLPLTADAASERATSGDRPAARRDVPRRLRRRAGRGPGRRHPGREPRLLRDGQQLAAARHRLRARR